MRGYAYEHCSCRMSVGLLLFMYSQGNRNPTCTCVHNNLDRECDAHLLGLSLPPPPLPSAVCCAA
jgi:hypothetical protein